MKESVRALSCGRARREARLETRFPCFGRGCRFQLQRAISVLCFGVTSLTTAPETCSGLYHSREYDCLQVLTRPPDGVFCCVLPCHFHASWPPSPQHSPHANEHPDFIGGKARSHRRTAHADYAAGAGGLITTLYDPTSVDNIHSPQPLLHLAYLASPAAKWFGSAHVHVVGEERGMCLEDDNERIISPIPTFQLDMRANEHRNIRAASC